MFLMLTLLAKLTEHLVNSYLTNKIYIHDMYFLKDINEIEFKHDKNACFGWFLCLLNLTLRFRFR